MNRTDPLDVDIIKADLQRRLIGTEAVVYESTSSTNDIAWEYAKNENNNGLAIFAEEQTAGRGRGGNKWLSGKGESILCSILLLDRKCGAELLTLAAALAVGESIIEHCGLDAKIKWPNDVVVNGKKIAGILLESRTHNDSGDYVIGIGINCHQQKDFFEAGELQMPATSIDIESGRSVERNLLAAALLRSIDKWAETAENSSETVVAKWQQMSNQLGHRVTVRYNRKHFTGNCIGLDPAEGLILQLEHGGVRMFDAAHTTIIKHL
jgi:BirA family biotin operon repressor/biotin-[acetyl-CoA-carboxylase] ligase